MVFVLTATAAVHDYRTKVKRELRRQGEFKGLFALHHWRSKGNRCRVQKIRLNMHRIYKLQDRKMCFQSRFAKESGTDGSLEYSFPVETVKMDTKTDQLGMF